MPELPTWGDVTDSAEQTGRNLIPWLSDPYTCDYCGSYCFADTAYVKSQADVMKVWECRECDTQYYRDEQESLTSRPDRRE